MVGKRILGRSVASRLDYIADAEKPEDIPERPDGDPMQGMGSKVLAAGAINADNFQAAAKEIRDLDEAFTGKAATTEHIMFSWREQGEGRPSPEEMEAAVKEAMDKIGLPDAPCCWTAHQDTGHIHCHLVVSRVGTDEHSGRLKIIDGTAWVTDTKKHNHNNVVESVHVALAVLCDRFGWQPEAHARYDASLQRIHYPPDLTKDGLRLSQKIRDAEAQTGKQHPSHTLALAAVPILRGAKDWDEAKEKLAAAGIKIEIKALKNGGQGAVLSTSFGARTKLSALPKDCSFRSLDLRYRALGPLGPSLSDSRPAPAPNAQAAAKLAATSPTVKPWTPARVKKQAARIASDSAGWDDILKGMTREGWQLQRAGKSGALIVAQDAKTGSEIRVKMSDIPGRNSLHNLAKKFDGITLEEAYQNGLISKELFEAVVKYPETTAKASQPGQPTNSTAQGQTPAPADPDAIRLPSSVTDNEALTGRPDPLRILAETARDTIRESIKIDSSITQTAERLAVKGIEMAPVIHGGQMRGIRLSAPGVQGSISLSNLPRDVRLGALAKAFGEKYRDSKPTARRVSGSSPGMTVVEIMPEDDAMTILEKTLQAIARDMQQSSGGMTIWDFDTRPITLLQARPADQDAALDIAKPTDLDASQAARWKTEEIVKHIFSESWKDHKFKIENGSQKSGDWSFVQNELDKRGWRMEMIDNDLQIITDKNDVIKLSELDIKANSFIKHYGEPDVPLVANTGETAEQTAIRKNAIQYGRVISIAKFDVRNAIEKIDSFDALQKWLKDRGFVLEDSIKSISVRIDDHTSIDLAAIKVDIQAFEKKIGDIALPISGWDKMDEAQRREAQQKVDLRQDFKSETWAGVLEALDKRGAQLELTSQDGMAGRVVLADGHKIKISDFGPGLAQRHAQHPKPDTLAAALAARKAARAAKAKALEEAKTKEDKDKAAKEKQEKEQRDAETQRKEQGRQDAAIAKSKAVKAAPTAVEANAAASTKVQDDKAAQARALKEARDAVDASLNQRRADIISRAPDYKPAQAQAQAAQPGKPGKATMTPQAQVKTKTQADAQAQARAKAQQQHKPTDHTQEQREREEKERKEREKRERAEAEIRAMSNSVRDFVDRNGGTTYKQGVIEAQNMEMEAARLQQQAHNLEHQAQMHQ